MTRRVVLLGGGYVTLHACAQLRRRLRAEIRRGDVELVVVSTDTAHNFHGFTVEVLAGLLPAARTRTPLESVCRSARVIHASVTVVDPVRRVVEYQPASGGAPVRLGYDHLVIGTGGREPVAEVPGLREFGHTVRTAGELQRFGSVIDRLADRGNACVVVAGGGLAGVELAAAIADRGRGRMVVTLVHSGAALLAVLRAEHPSLARRAEQELDRLCVRVLPGVRLAGVAPGAAVLSDGTLLAADAVLGAIGQRPVVLPGLDGALRDGVGRLITSPDLRVAERIWAAGDAALVRHPRTGTPVPANALWAIKGGAHVGANIARVLRGHKPRRFRYRGLGQAASFGLGRSIAELYGVPFTGTLAWLLRLTFFLRFLPSRRRAPLVLSDLAQAILGRRFRTRAFMDRGGLRSSAVTTAAPLISPLVSGRRRA